MSSIACEIAGPDRNFSLIFLIDFDKLIAYSPITLRQLSVVRHLLQHRSLSIEFIKSLVPYVVILFSTRSAYLILLPQGKVLIPKKQGAYFFFEKQQNVKQSLDVHVTEDQQENGLVVPGSFLA